MAITIEGGITIGPGITMSVKLTNNSGITATVYSGGLSYFSAYLIR